jgi:hypothetical protein
LVATFLFLALPLAGCSKKTLDLVGPPLKVGDKVRSSKTLILEDASATITVGGSVIVGKMSLNARSSEVNEVLEVNAGRPGKVRTTVIEDVTERTMDINGNVDRDTERNLLDGRTYLATRVGDAWKFDLQGGGATDKIRSTLNKLARNYMGPNEESDLYRKAAVGESWKPDAVAVRRYFSDTIVEYGNVNLKLEGVEQIDGQRCAVIAITIDFRGKMLDDDNEQFTMEVGATGKIYRSLDEYVDVRTSLTGTMTLSGETVRDGQTLQMKFSGPMTLSSTAKRG